MMGDRCQACGQPIVEAAEWQWAFRADGITSYWRGEGALDSAYAAAERYLDRDDATHAAILLSTSSGVSWGVADTRDPGGEWVCGPDRWRSNYDEARREGRAA